MTRWRWLAALVAGGLFGFGLAWSTMIRPEVVIDFLLLRDLGLLFVLGGAVFVALACYQLAPRVLRQPVLGGVFEQRRSTLDRRTVLGAAIFGVGWGLCGVCPGPAIAGLGAGNWPLLMALAGIFVGAYLQGRLFPGR